jgi:hypothetical protein
VQASAAARSVAPARPAVSCINTWLNACRGANLIVAINLPDLARCSGQQRLSRTMHGRLPLPQRRDPSSWVVAAMIDGSGSSLVHPGVATEARPAQILSYVSVSIDEWDPMVQGADAATDVGRLVLVIAQMIGQLRL